jgi:hypothetical protein
MDRIVYIDNKPVLSDDLNFITDSKNDQVRERAQAFLGSSRELSFGLTTTSGSVFRGGICGNPLDYWNPYTNLNVTNFGVNFTLASYSGKAITAGGDLIDAGFSLIFWNPFFPPGGNWSVFPNTVAYVKMQYQEASSSLEYDNYGVAHYLHYDRYYNLVANNSLPSSNEVLLATFLGDSTGHITLGTLQDHRGYVTTVTPASSVLLNPTLQPAAALGWTTFENHAHAYGTGTPSIVNPHGSSLADVGALSSTGSINYKTFSSISVGPTMVFNTIYQNTYGYAIGVSPLCFGTVWSNGGAPATASIQLLVGSSSPPTTVADDFKCIIGNIGANTSGSISRNLLGIVPNSWYYELVPVTTPNAVGQGATARVLATNYYLTLS